MDVADIWLVVWLGNEGDLYTRTRHNAAWIILDNQEQSVNKLDWIHDKYLKAHIANTHLFGIPCVYIKPTTMMNNSGESVSEAAHRYGCPASRIIVVHDDVDISLGSFSLAIGKGDGNHNGVKSIIQALRTREFPRVRIGVAPLEYPRTQRLNGFVMGNFNDMEFGLLKSMALSVRRSIECIIVNGLTKALNIYNKKTA